MTWKTECRSFSSEKKRYETYYKNKKLYEAGLKRKHTEKSEKREKKLFMDCRRSFTLCISVLVLCILFYPQPQNFPSLNYKVKFGLNLLVK